MTDAEQELVVTELLRRLRGGLGVCGIAGVLERSGRPVDARAPAAHGRRDRPSRPGRRGPARRRPGRPRQPPAGDHRPDAGGRDADGVRRRPLLDHLQRRDLQLRASCAPSSRPPATASARTPTPRSCCTPTRPGGRRASSASTACSRSRSGTASAPSCSSPATASASSRSTTPTSADAFLFGSEIKSMLEHDALTRAHEPPAPARVLHVPEHLHRRHAVRRRPAAAARPPPHRPRRTAVRARPQQYWDFDFRETSDGRRVRRGVPGGARPPVPPGRRADSS